MDAGGREGHPIVGANRARQPVLPKEPIEDGAHAVTFRGQQTVACQEIARVLIRDRERIAVERVPRAEVALEVGGPEIVGLAGRSRNHARVLPLPPPAPLLDQPAAGQQIARGTDGRPLDARMPRLQPGQQFGRAPRRMLAARRSLLR